MLLDNNGELSDSQMRGTTAGDGSYAFENMPANDSGQGYRPALNYEQVARSSAANSGSGQLRWWIGARVDGYRPGLGFNLGNFDLAGVTLVSPGDTTPRAAPITFRWQARGVRGDSYRVYIYDHALHAVARSVPTEENNFTMTSLLPCFVYNESYYWTVRVYNSAGSGEAADMLPLVFAAHSDGPTPTAAATQPLVATATPAPTRTATATALAPKRFRLILPVTWRKAST